MRSTWSRTIGNVWSPTRAEPSESDGEPADRERRPVRPPRAPPSSRRIPPARRRPHARDPRHQAAIPARGPPPPTPMSTASTSGTCPSISIPSRPLTGDHLGLVERMHHQSAGLLRSRCQRLVRLGEVPLDDRDVRSVSPHAIDLRLRGRRRDEDLRGHSRLAGGVRDGRDRSSRRTPRSRPRAAPRSRGAC